MNAAELIAKLQLLPSDTVIAVDVDGVPHHVSRTALAVVHEPGIAYIDASPWSITAAQEDVTT